MKLGDFFCCAILVVDFASCLLLWFCCFLFDAAIAAVESCGYLFFFVPLAPQGRIHTRVSVTCCFLRQKQQQQLL